MTLTDAYKSLVFKKQIPDKNFLVPLLKWLSGAEENIELTQRINRRFYWVNQKINISELTLYNNIKGFIKYPKAGKDDERLKFFYDDICKFYGWTHREFKNNLKVLDLEELKPAMSKIFGYDNVQRKQLGLPPLNLK